MAKAKNTAFFCKECGYESAKWFGQCPACKEWNTFVEEPVSKPKSAKGIAGTSQRAAASSAPVPVEINSVSFEENDRTSTGIAELDRVLGGGIVAGSLVLVGGDPGIGKSTLLLQMCYNLSAAGKDVLYISGEESLKQIKLRADRIGKCSGTLKLLCETSLDSIEDILTRNKPEIVIIDTIQTMYKEDVAAAPGSVSQVRETTSILMQLAKGLNITIFIVGHVTKEGTVAGPRMLEHMVDTVLYFEGDRYASYRILRGVKNRFGSTNEIGVFEMQQSGLSEVENPSEYMLNGRPENASGSVVVCLLEGTRPIMVEIQALVCDSNFGMARRTAAGTDYNRVNLLMAVLEKRAGIHMSGSDAYVNVAGGIKVSEPALDLGIVMALVSSFKNRAIDEKTVIFGEVGLAGEVRAVSQAQQRVNEAVKLGFKTCILPGVCLKNIKKNDKIEIIGVNNVQEAIKLMSNEAMVNNLTNILNGLDDSQEKLEKDAFDVINSSDTSLNLVKESMSSVEEILGMIESMNKVVEESSAKIKELEALSKKIEEFAAVISSISNRTNILSLNASIEAARAGEHGRGFAVVASEVRNLAAQSAKSSKEITDTINKVQTSVDETVTAMKNIYDNSSKQKEKADDVGNVLKKVIDAAYTANEVARNIENEIAYQREITDEAKNALKA